jgi:hypothetical protein
MQTKKQQAVIDSVSRVLSEDVLTLKQAAIELASVTGKRPDKSTLFRWIARGVGGVKLDGARVGRDWITSKQALTRFIQERSAGN